MTAPEDVYEDEEEGIVGPAFEPVEVPEETDEHKAMIAVISGLVPATAQQVGLALGKLTRRLQELTELLAQADRDATHLSEAHELAYDQAFLRAAQREDRVTVCKSIARIETAQLRLDMEVAKLAVRSLKEAHKTLDRRIDVGRTQAATVRSEHRTIGYGQ